MKRQGRDLLPFGYLCQIMKYMKIWKMHVTIVSK